MQLGKPGWLKTLLETAVVGHAPDTTSAAALDAVRLSPGPARARRYLRLALRESGLIYGTPADRAGSTGTGGSEEKLYLSVLAALCRIGLNVAHKVEAPPGPRLEQLLLLLAAMAGRLDDAEQMHRRIEGATKKRAWPPPDKLWQGIEEALEERAMSVAGDPYYGLVLHNGALYSDAQLFGQLAIAYFRKGAFPREAAQRRIHFAHAQKALLGQVLIGLVVAERRPSYPARRAILRQLEDLQLPEQLADGLRTFAKKAFDRPPSLKTVLKDVRSQNMKLFILEQVLLASLVDGRRSPREIEFLKTLAMTLGIEREQRKRIELEVAEFYKRHRDVVDVFTVSAGAEVMGEELVDSMQHTLEKNFQALLKEVKETQDLTVLLARAARGQSLTSDEKRRMRAQLVDIAKAVPALAIFAAPGGVLLLIALAKVLPFNLLPSSFQETSDERDEPQEP